MLDRRYSAYISRHMPVHRAAATPTIAVRCHHGVYSSSETEGLGSESGLAIDRFAVDSPRNEVCGTWFHNQPLRATLAHEAIRDGEDHPRHESECHHRSQDQQRTTCPPRRMGGKLFVIIFD